MPGGDSSSDDDDGAAYGREMDDQLCYTSSDFRRDQDMHGGAYARYKRSLMRESRHNQDDDSDSTDIDQIDDY
jgi:hypothetical protein